MNIANALSYGGITAVIGVLIVFLGLTILIFCISIMGAIFKSIDQKKKSVKETKSAPAPAAAAPAPAAAEMPANVEVTMENDPQLIAVIAAAIAAFDNSGKRLVVRKVRRVQNWNSAARQEQIYHL